MNDLEAENEKLREEIKQLHANQEQEAKDYCALMDRLDAYIVFERTVKDAWATLEFRLRKLRTGG